MSSISPEVQTDVGRLQQGFQVHPATSGHLTDLHWTFTRSPPYDAIRMKPDRVPDTVQAIIAQAGGLGLRGAFVYVGASGLTYRCDVMEGEHRSGRRSQFISRDGLGSVEFEVGVRFRVNGKRGRAWAIIVAYEPDDTYTVWLVEGHHDRPPGLAVLTCRRDVYCDTLQSAIEAIYDEAIRQHNQGFIPLS